MGRHDESDRYLADFTKKYSKLDPYSLAWMHASRGEKDQAFKWLDLAFQAHATGMTSLRLELPLRSLHCDPRYTALLHKMDLLE
jgi:adenylate cyclase